MARGELIVLEENNGARKELVEPIVDGWELITTEDQGGANTWPMEGMTPLPLMGEHNMIKFEFTNEEFEQSRGIYSNLLKLGAHLTNRPMVKMKLFQTKMKFLKFNVCTPRMGG